MDPALLAGVDDNSDEGTSLAGVKGNTTSLAGVPIPIAPISDDKSNHNSVDPNEANDISSKASIRSTGSHAPVHNMTDELPQHPRGEEEQDNIQLPELVTQVPVLHQSKRVSVPPSDYIP